MPQPIPVSWFVVDDADAALAGPFASERDALSGLLAVAAVSSEVIRLVRTDSR